MKTYYLILSFLILSLISYGQDTTFVKIYYDPAGNMTSSKVVANHESGFITSGKKDWHSLVINADSLGNILWAKTLTATGYNSLFNDIIATSDSGYIATGNFSGSGIHTVICAKFNQIGDTLWTRSFQTVVDNGSDQTITRIVETYDSSYVLTWADPTNDQTMLVKIDADGSVIWEKIIDNLHLESRAIESLADSSIYLAGTNYPDGSALIKLSSSGDVIWAQNLDEKDLLDMVYVNDAFYIAYRHSGLGVMKIDTSGAVIWAKKEPMNGGSTTTLTIQSDSTLTLQSGDMGYSDAILKMDFDGIPITHNDCFIILGDAAPHKYGGTFILGNGPIFGIKEFLQEHIGVIKTDSMLLAVDCIYPSWAIVPTGDTCITVPLTPTSTNGISTVSMNFQLSVPLIITEDRCIYMTSGLEEIENSSVKVYPNTTDGIAHFEFSKSGEYEVWLSTIEGKIVGKTIMNGVEGEMDLTNLGAGVYIYSIVNASQTMSGRIIRE